MLKRGLPVAVLPRPVWPVRCVTTDAGNHVKTAVLTVYAEPTVLPGQRCCRF
jgi:hypothetical protein